MPMTGAVAFVLGVRLQKIFYVEIYSILIKKYTTLTKKTLTVDSKHFEM